MSHESCWGGCWQDLPYYGGLFRLIVLIRRLWDGSMGNSNEKVRFNYNVNKNVQKRNSFTADPVGNNFFVNFVSFLFKCLNSFLSRARNSERLKWTVHFFLRRSSVTTVKTVLPISMIEPGRHLPHHWAWAFFIWLKKIKIKKWQESSGRFHCLFNMLRVEPGRALL